jgi:phosphatidylcholine synthase
VIFRPLTVTLTGIWLLSYALILQQMPTPHPLFVIFSLFYLLYYVGLSLYLTLRKEKNDPFHPKTRTFR